MPQPWMADAACRGLTSLMFAQRGDYRTVEAARAVCASCPVLAQCRDWALNAADAPADGIIAGLSARERKTLRRAAAVSRRPRPRQARPASTRGPRVHDLVVRPEAPTTAWTRSELLEVRAAEG